LREGVILLNVDDLDAVASYFGLLTYIPVKSHGRINVIKCIRDCMILISFPGLDVGARYWNTPYFPVRTRNLVWRALLREGVILLNVDDVKSHGRINVIKCISDCMILISFPGLDVA
jgi:hypothetical protein